MPNKENSFVLLFDYDSMLYKAAYRICSISDIRGWISKGKSKEWMTTEIINLTLNRVSQMDTHIFEEIEDTGIHIESVEYFLTTCKNSARKKAYPEYKANRKRRKDNLGFWVSKVRAELLKIGGFAVHDEFEADDLIKDRAVELGEGNYVVCSPDKDLKQIPGIRFDYWRTPSKQNEKGQYIQNRCRGLDIMTEHESDIFYYTQLLTGDSGDNIKGIPGFGPVKAKKILSDSVDYEETVKEEYIKYFGEKEGIRQFELHKLLIGLGINHRP